MKITQIMTQVKLEKYVRDFVKICEKSTGDKSDRLEGRKGKPGKTANAVRNIADSARGAMEAIDEIDQGSIYKGMGLGVLSGVTLGADIIGTKYNRNELKKLIDWLYTKPDEVRPVLVKAAVEIFVCFQQQLLNVTADGNWQWAMYKLAEDAVERFFDYFKNNDITEITADAVTEGVVTGKSKKYRLMAFEGHTVKYNEETEWKTSEMYSRVGLVKLDSNDAITGYYKKSNEKCDPAKFSYRLLFPWEENESFEEIEKPDSILNFSIKRTDIEQHAEWILNEINKHDPNLMEGRLHSGVAGAKAEVILHSNENCQKTLNAIELLGKKIDANLACKNPMEESPNARPDGKGETSASSTKSFQTPILYGVERPTKHFEGRTSQLSSIAQFFEEGNKVVLTGIGGMGKSELAKKFIHNENEADNRLNLIWFNATTTQNLKDSVKKLAKEKLRLTTENEDPSGMYRLLENEKVIFIFDDAKDYNSIAEYLPYQTNHKHKFLITSNMHDWHICRDTFKTVPIEDFSLEEAGAFIKSVLEIKDESQDQDINQLAKLMCFLPLALGNATAFIQKTNCTISHYLQTYQESPHKLMKKNFSTEQQKTIHRTFEIALDKIKKEDEENYDDIWKILSVMSYLSPNEIPRGIFLHEYLHNMENIDTTLKLLPLKNYSIVKEENEMLSIHGMNQMACRLENQSAMKEEEQLDLSLKLLGAHDSEDVAKHVISVWDHAFKYKNLIEKYILKCKNETPGFTNPLGIIIDGNKLDKVTEILKHIPKDDFKDLMDETKVWIKNLNKGLLDLLWEKGMDQNYKSVNWDSLLHMVADQGELQSVKFLVEEHNIKPDLINRMGFSPLHFAAKGGHYDVVQYLLNLDGVNAVDVNRLSKNNFSPLHLASANGHLNIVKHLQDKGANIAALTGAGDTAYELAERNGHKEITEFLDPLFRDPFSDPLLEAARNNNIEEVKRIIESGDTRSVEDQSGRTAVHYAAMNGHIDIVRYLAKVTHYDLTAADDEDNTPLHYAARNGHQAVVKFLIFLNPNIDTEIIVNCCHLARKNGHEQLFRFLREIDCHYRHGCHRRRSGRYRRSFDSDLDDDKIDEFFCEHFRERYELERRGD